MPPGRRAGLTLIKANNAMAMGLCSPTSGGQEMGDPLDLFDSQVTVWSNDPMNPTVAAEVAKMDVERRIRMWTTGVSFVPLKSRVRAITTTFM